MSGSANNKPKEGGGDKKQIKLKVVGPGGTEIHFKVKITSKIGKMMRKYAGTLEVPRIFLRFLFGGRQINDDETPEQLKMKANDVIEAQIQAPCVNPSEMSQFQIQVLLQCIVCLAPSASPIHTCPNGHLICGFCHDKLKTPVAICPHCKSGDLRPNPLGERQSRQNDMQGSCPFDGCTVPALASDMMDHVTVCEYRDIQCTSTRLGGSAGACNKMFPLEEFPRHAITAHQVAMAYGHMMIGLIPNDSFMKVSVRYGPAVPFRAGNEESAKYWGQGPKNFYPALCEYDGKYFTVHAAAENYKFHWWVTIFGGQKKADRYQYETELVWKNVEEQKTKNVRVQNLPVLPFNLYEKYDKLCGNKYAMVDAATAMAYSEVSADGIGLTVQIKLSKVRRKRTKRTADTAIASTSKKSK